MKKRLFTFFTLLLCVCSGAWGDEIIFSMAPNVSSNVTITAASTESWTEQDISSNLASGFIGTSAYGISKKTSSQTIIKDQNSGDAFNIGDNSVGFKITFSSALKNGDVITAGSASNQISFTTTATRATTYSTTSGTYTVTDGDGLADATTIYIWRASGSGTTFKSLTITRPTLYTITHSASTNGSYTIKVGSADAVSTSTTSAAGATITLAATPDSGYKLDAWNVTKTSGGDAVEVTNNAFTMPAEAVTIAPTFVAAATGISVTLDKGDGDGVAPSALTDQTEGTEITLPKNFTMYKEGYTMTGWDENGDGTADYAPGDAYTIPASDATLTAIYTENAKTLADRTGAVTIKWDFLRGNGAPTVEWGEGSGAHFWVAQASIAGETIDVKLPINVTASGKFNNKGWTDWIQINNTTEMTIPSAEGAVITVGVYGEGNASTVNGNTNDSYATYVNTYNVAATDATAAFVANSGETNAYYKYIQVVLPKIMITPDPGYFFNLNMTYSGSDVNVTHGTETALGSYGTATSGCDVVIGNKNGSDNAKAKLTSSGVFFNGNDAYIKIDFNFTLKTDDVITFTSSNDNQICFTTTNSRNDTEKTTSKSYTVGSTTATLNGASTIYIWRASTSATYLKTLKIFRPGNITTTIGATGWSTYSNVNALDFANATPAGMSAYTVTGFSGTALTRSEALTSAPGSTGLLLNGSAGETYTIPVLASSSTVTTSNKLVASVNGGTVAAGTGTTVNYVLMNNSGSPEFQWIGANSATLGANKAYLALVDGPKPTPSAPGLWFDFGNEGETTGISTSLNDKVEMINDNAIYNLNGQRVAQPTKGLYIVNGKKVIVK